MHAYNEGCEIKFDHMPLVMCIYLMLFFERTTQDSACFIDIAEKKYKTTIQVKKKTRPVGLGHRRGPQTTSPRERAAPPTFTPMKSSKPVQIGLSVNRKPPEVDDTMTRM